MALLSRNEIHAQIVDFTGGERGTRTLDLGIMSSESINLHANSTTYRVAPVALDTTERNEAAPGPAKLPQD